MNIKLTLPHIFPLAKFRQQEIKKALPHTKTILEIVEPFKESCGFPEHLRTSMEKVEFLKELNLDDPEVVDDLSRNYEIQRWFGYLNGKDIKWLLEIFMEIINFTEKIDLPDLDLNGVLDNWKKFADEGILFLDRLQSGPILNFSFQLQLNSNLPKLVGPATTKVLDTRYKVFSSAK